ncbi:hypothetical protein GOBAR_DD05523 [Gossypium barbadense]|nr:hypothetical protein GOBAR_DD05523 [Gossypium barbadense]
MSLIYHYSKAVDTSLIKSIEGVLDLKAYLGTRFSLKSGMKPHELDDGPDVEGNTSEIRDIVSATRILKKKKLKINVHRPVGTRVVFDEEGNTQAQLAMLADKTSGDILLDQGFCSYLVY